MKRGIAIAAAVVVVAVTVVFLSAHLNAPPTFTPPVTQDPQSAWPADTAYVDSVYVPIAAIGDLMRYELRRPRHDVDGKQFAAILRLAQRAQADSREGIPRGWATIAAGFEDRTTDIVGMWPALKWLRANCTFNVDPNAPQGGGGVNGLHCPPNPPTVYMHQGPRQDGIAADQAYGEVILGFSTSYAAAWNAANLKDPELSDPKQVDDVLTTADRELDGVVDWSDYRKRRRHRVYETATLQAIVLLAADEADPILRQFIVDCAKRLLSAQISAWSALSERDTPA